jgi:stage II sporulation protein D
MDADRLIKVIVLFSLLLVGGAISAVAAGAETTLAVRVMETRLGPSVTIEAKDPFRVSWEGGSADVKKLVLEAEGTGWLTLSLGGEEKKAVPPVTIAPLKPATIFTVRGKADRHRYRGGLAASRDGGEVLLINSVGLEEYLLSVVGAELSTTDREALRAQAILCRTFALKNRKRHGAWDLCDLTHCQHYGGVETETAAGTRAVRETCGMILTYEGVPATVFYHSSSGGMTTSPKYVWGGPDVPYLVPVPDVYAGRDLSAASPDRTWRFVIEKGRLLAALSDAVGTRVTGLAVTERDPSGRAAKIRLIGAEREVRGEEFRIVVCRAFGWGSLKSTLFEMKEAGGNYLFDGRGLGHGVGMSQWGAVELARMGKKYREILEFYFPGTRVERVGGSQ